MTTKLQRYDGKASESATTQRLFAEPGGRKRFARLKAVYQSARPRRLGGGPCIRTADEVFRYTARKDGFSEEEVTRFIDHLDL